MAASAWCALVSAMGRCGAGGSEAAGEVERAMAAMAACDGDGALVRAAERNVTLQCCREVEDVCLPRLGETLRDAAAALEADGAAATGPRASAALERGLAELISVLDAQAAWVRCLGGSGWEGRKRAYEEEVTAILTRHLPRELPALLRAHYGGMIAESIARLEEEGAGESIFQTLARKR